MSNALFQDSLMLQGYKACRIKDGLDPIPMDSEGNRFLVGTEGYRKFMAGWNHALTEIEILANAMIVKEKQ